MSVLRVQGGRRLEGVITVEGNKNAALPLIVATLLTTEPVTLHNVPRIRDVDVLLDLLEGLGSTVEGRGTSTLTLRGAERPGTTPDPILVGRVRASLLLMGPLLARRGEVHLAAPGGDFPSRRTLSTHVQALTALGARAIAGTAHAFDTPEGLRGASFYMDEASVTATETGVARGGDGGGRDRDSPCGDRAARRRAVRIAHGDGSPDRGRRFVTVARGRRATAPRRRSHLARRLHRGRDLGGDCCRHAGRDRRARRRPRRSRAHRQRAAAHAGALRPDGQRRARQPRSLHRHRAPRDGPVARVPQRHGESLHRAGHPGAGSHARSTTGCTSCACSPSSS